MFLNSFHMIIATLDLLRNYVQYYFSNWVSKNWDSLLVFCFPHHPSISKQKFGLEFSKLAPITGCKWPQNWKESDGRCIDESREWKWNACKWISSCHHGIHDSAVTRNQFIKALITALQLFNTLVAEWAHPLKLNWGSWLVRGSWLK